MVIFNFEFRIKYRTNMKQLFWDIMLFLIIFISNLLFDAVEKNTLNILYIDPHFSSTSEIPLF